jgi:hypothetical protein
VMSKSLSKPADSNAVNIPRRQSTWHQKPQGSDS